MAKWVTVMSAESGGKLILDVEQITMIDAENCFIYIGNSQVEIAEFELNEILQMIGVNAGGNENDNFYGNIDFGA